MCTRVYEIGENVTQRARLLFYLVNVIFPVYRLDTFT